jgi:hypothetical protein
MMTKRKRGAATMTYGRPISPITVKDNADGTIDVTCILCHQTWTNLKDKNWPALHAGVH